MARKTTSAVELLAPAGEPDAGYAALHYGADAVYLGLPRFSARAEAANFTLDSLDEIVAYAHALRPRRRVYVTLNTLVLNAELGDVVTLLGALADLEVDAAIVQDLGVAAIARAHLPHLRLHASTQMAVHNLAGAAVLRALGFARVTLARELTLDEVRRIAAGCGIETETFIHGALCYSYSGLCLCSSLLRGRSGNRGRCAYVCREACQVEGPPPDGYAFSMKDLSWAEYVAPLREAGVASFKIEGRMKSPLYVAAAVHYYRGLLDGMLAPAAARQCEADIQSVFSRPWTRLFIESPDEQQAADRDTVGHRGVAIGTVETVRRAAKGVHAIGFVTQREIERHDGLQIDLERIGQPFGFAVESLRLGTGARQREEFVAPAGSRVEVDLPRQHPDIPVGATVYCSSSQATRRRYRFERPKPGLYRVRRRMDLEVTASADGLSARARVEPRGPWEEAVEAEVAAAGHFGPARDPSKTVEAARAAFERLGDTRLELGAFACRSPGGFFVPVSEMNRFRRQVTAEVEARLGAALEGRMAAIRRAVVGDGTRARVGPREPRWSVKVDRIGLLAEFTEADGRDLDEAIVDIGRDSFGDLEEGLARLAGLVGQERVRLGIPTLARDWEEDEIRRRIERLRSAGWTRWQASNLAAWTFLGIDPATGRAADAATDLAADWPLYAMNRCAVRRLLEMGVTGFTLSPEDARENMASLLEEFGDRATVIVHQDTPLFLSESCAFANLAGGCVGGSECRRSVLRMRLEGGESVLAIQDDCRTVVVGERPFCLADRLAVLHDMGASRVRADFIWRPYTAAEVHSLWQRLRAGGDGVAGHPGNFLRGLA